MPGAATMAIASIDSIAVKARSISAAFSDFVLTTKQLVPPFLKNPYTAWVSARCPG